MGNKICLILPFVFMAVIALIVCTILYLANASDEKIRGYAEYHSGDVVHFKINDDKGVILWSSCYSNGECRYMVRLKDQSRDYFQGSELME